MTHTSRLLGNAESSIRAVAARVLAPPSPVCYTEWARANIVFGSESAFPGRYDPDLFPFYRRVLDCLGPDHPARVVVLLKSIQIGGTVVGQVFAGGSMDLDPGPFMYVHPTLENGRRWVNMKWAPMVRQSESLLRLINIDRGRDSKSSTFYMERRDGRGSLLVSGANSPSSLSQVSIPRQVQDDLQRWEVNAAGDPEDQADGRSEGFEFAKIFKTGTGALDGECRMTRAYRAGTMETYEVPCPHCGTYQALEWENMLAHLDDEHPEDAHFVCIDCGAVIEHKDKRAMVAAGRWTAEHPDRSTASFYIWSAYSPLTTWERIARRWLEAKGTPHAERVFVNEMTGKAWRGEGDAPEWEWVRDRAEEYGGPRGTVPADGLLLVAGVDCQKDRLEVKIKAVGRDRRSWTVDYFVIDGHIGSDKARAGLDALMDGARTWPDAAGAPRRVEMLAIDSGNWTEEVYDWARRWPEDRVMCVKGASSDSAPPLDMGRRPSVSFRGRKRKARVRLWLVGVSGLKTQFYSDLRQADPAGRGWCGFPRGLPDDYYQQLTCERRSPVTTRAGYIVYRWQKPSGQPNEALDTEIYARAAALRLGWHRLSDAQWDALEAKRAAERKAPQSDLFEPDRSETIRPASSQAEAPDASAARRRPAPAAADRGEIYL